MQEKENIIDILKKTKDAIKHNDIILLKELSNRTVHTASIYQDPDNIIVAVIVYSLSKVIERKKYTEYAAWPKFFKACMNSLEKTIIALQHDNLEGFRVHIKNIRHTINKLSGHLRLYIENVFRKAMINKASRIYEHGISLEQTAKILGITTFELAEYAGKTGIADVDLSITKDIKDRLKDSLEIFNKAEIFIFDSSAVISLALNNLLGMLATLKKNFKGKFIMTNEVKREIIDKPLNIKKFELEALMIQQLLKNGIFEAESIFRDYNAKEELNNVLENANHAFISDSEWIKIIGEGEASCLALSNYLERKRIEHAIIIDERTARMLCENSENLRKLLELKLHRPVKTDSQKAGAFSNKKILRSSELCYIAYKKNLIAIEDGRKLIDALLYAVKYKGCAISRREIEEAENLAWKKNF